MGKSLFRKTRVHRDVDIFDIASVTIFCGQSLLLAWTLQSPDIDGDGDAAIFNVIIAPSIYGRHWCKTANLGLF